MLTWPHSGVPRAYGRLGSRGRSRQRHPARTVPCAEPRRSRAADLRPERHAQPFLGQERGGLQRVVRDIRRGARGGAVLPRARRARGARWTAGRTTDCSQRTWCGSSSRSTRPSRRTRATRCATDGSRSATYTDARRFLVESIGPLLLTIRAWYAKQMPLDNSALLARRIYLTDLERFERVCEAAGRDLEAAIRRLIEAHKSGALESWARHRLRFAQVPASIRYDDADDSPRGARNQL